MEYVVKNTALHLAARAGHTAAVRLLLNRGAQILLNHSDASFLHEAIHNGRKDVTSAVIDSDRQVEISPIMHPGYRPRLIKRSVACVPLLIEEGVACVCFLH